MIDKHHLFFTALIATNSCFASVHESNDSAKYNVLFIVVDDLKPKLACYGDEFAKTPNIDLLANNSIIFTNAHCAQAICGPSRVSLLTGMRPDNTRTWFMNKNSEFTLFRELNPDIISLPQLFKESGYTSIGIGKVFDERNLTEIEDSISWSQPSEYFNAKGVAYALRNDKPDKGAFGPQYNKLRPSVESADVDDEVYFDGRICEGAVDFIEEFANSGEPFFLAVGFRRPHLPFTAPKKYWDLYNQTDFQPAVFQEHAEHSPDFAYHNFEELRSYKDIPDTGAISINKQIELIHAYYACVSYVDAQIGLLLKKLKEKNLDENTIIVLVGDNGWHLGDHGLWCKLTNYEQSTRVPLIISVPGINSSGQSTNTPVELVDVFPTLCDLNNIKGPIGLDGISLTPVFNDISKKVKNAAISQFPRGNRMGYTYRTDRYRYIIWIEKDFEEDSRDGKIVARELFDYLSDPLEKVNLVFRPEYKKINKLFEEFADGTYDKIEDTTLEFDIKPEGIIF
jgi:iduronate 2-sulfatase